MESLRDAYRAHVQERVQAIQAILVEEGYDRLVLYSGDVVLRSRFDDMDWPFQPLAMFRWLAPLPWPESVLVLPARAEPVLFAVRSDSFWERPVDPPWELLQAGLQVEIVPSPSDVKAMGWHGRSAFIGDQTPDTLVSPSTTVNPASILSRLDDLRTRKTPYEIECLARASRRAVKGHRAAEAAFRAGQTSELAVHLAYLMATEQDDAQTPYKNIVAMGRNGATLHHVDYQHPEHAPSMLIDAGAAWAGYAADITRTYVKNDGAASQVFASLVSAVEGLQQEVIGRVKPGLEYEDLHDQAHELLGRVLVDHDLVRGSPESAVALGLTRVFFPHGLGHSLGVQVHDVGCLPRPPKPGNEFLRNTRTIEANQVFTVEPGLYFIDGLLGPCRATEAGRAVHWDLVEELTPFGGVRIEDDVQVLATGVRNLTREAFAATE